MNKKSIFAGFLAVSLIVGVGVMGATQKAQAQTGSFGITHQVRNLNKQNFTWADSVVANPTERIEFQITITWQGGVATENVLVSEGLSEKLSYAGNLKLDGTPITGNVATQNLNIGTMGVGQSKRVTFEALVVPAEQLGPGTSDLVNTATVFNAQGAASTTALVQATRSGSPTDVATGPLSVWMIGFALVLLSAFIGSSLLFVRSYLRREVFESAYGTRTERRLAAMIKQIRKEEKKAL